LNYHLGKYINPHDTADTIDTRRTPQLALVTI